MMDPSFEKKLEAYAELILKVGLNFQPGQRLLIGVPVYNTGVPLEAAPLVRLLVAKAYQMGARYVDVIWGDDEILVARFINAQPNTFNEYPSWKANLLLDYVQQGDAILTVLGNDPDLLRDQDPDLVAHLQKIVLERTDPAMEYVRRSAVNWSVIAIPVKSWAAKVLPDVTSDVQVVKLWEAIFRTCRLDEENPMEAWQSHIRELVERCEFLNAKGYSGLTFTAPDTDLRIGLPKGHIWVNAHMSNQNGVPYTANLPTEEIFTLPHKGKADGVVRASMPLSYGGSLFEDLIVTFVEGRVVLVEAKKGAETLQKLIETDEGACRLGEVALVPHSSPIARTGLLFYNILLDENAATHLALGSAYKFSMKGGRSMSDDEFAAWGGNQSMLHIDFMIGSAEMDVDGITTRGAVEPVMRNGEWAFDVG
jgi:aminopeptidase